MFILRQFYFADSRFLVHIIINSIATKQIFAIAIEVQSMQMPINHVFFHKFNSPKIEKRIRNVIMCLI